MTGKFYPPDSRALGSAVWYRSHSYRTWSDDSDSDQVLVVVYGFDHVRLAVRG